MKIFGMIRVAAASPLVQVGDFKYNAEQIITIIDQAVQQKVSLIVFPELSVSAYSCGDLFLTSAVLDIAEWVLAQLKEATKSKPITAIVGAPISAGNKLYNCAVVVSNGKIAGIVPKTHLPNYGEFYEARWFAPGDTLSSQIITLCGDEVPVGTDLLFSMDDACIAIEICEDMWVGTPPSVNHCLAGANIICNLSASNEVIGKRKYRELLVKQRSMASHSAYIYASAGITESTTDTLYSGHLLIGENGSLLENYVQNEFQNDFVVTEIDLERLNYERRRRSTFVTQGIYRKISLPHGIQGFKQPVRRFSKTPFVPKGQQSMDERMEEIYRIQTLGLAKRLKHTGLKRPVIGISGGLDSTLALLVAARAMDKLGWDRKNIIGITMPGFGTSGRTLSNAKKLMAALNITSLEIDITDSCLKHFSDIGHDPEVHDVTFENTQARERTQILLDIANKEGGLVVGTGDLSELALGWATYAGDHISMYSVNAGVPKTLVCHIVAWTGGIMGSDIKNILDDILDTPISPELLPTEEGKLTQKTEEILGDYQLHDFFLYYFVRFGFSPDKILYLALNAFAGEYKESIIKDCLQTFFKRFFSQQFKRSCLPDGPKIGTVTLSPRSDWKMPSDAEATAWLDYLK